MICTVTGNSIFFNKQFRYCLCLKIKLLITVPLYYMSFLIVAFPGTLRY